ncbi:sensor histidine kinase [Nitriliruptoraceae bacterium ZYF776]|nr:sensor histidine kinase [Profundirhabdus halotolerans]
MTITQRFSRWLAAHRLAVDVAVVAILGPLVVVVSFESATVQPARSVAGWAIASILPVALRRRLPVTSAAAVFGVCAVQTLVGPPLVLPANLVVLVSLYTVTVYGPRWAGRVAMAGMVVGAASLVARWTRELGNELLTEAVSFGAIVVISGLAVWALAMLRRARLETMDALRDRAARLERERDQQALIAAAAERSRIAREMHDVVAHSLSIVVAQADGGRYAARDDPGAAVPVLATISDTGRAALADVRRILGVLRDGTAAAGHTEPTSFLPSASDAGAPARDDVAPRAPQPSAGDVAALLDGVRRAGLEVTVDDVGTPVTVTAGLELTIHRLLQEALTNVLKHAGPDPTVSVVRRWTGDRLVIEVEDDGRGVASEAPVPGSGLGLLGMRERVALFDGELHTGPRPGGGFRVRAELPLTRATPVAGGEEDEP